MNQVKVSVVCLPQFKNIFITFVMSLMIYFWGVKKYIYFSLLSHLTLNGFGIFLLIHVISLLAC